jgi:hypothetical protein
VAVLVGVGVAAAGLVLGGCSGDAGDADAFRADIEMMARSFDSEFVKGVLADDKVTQEEVDEALARQLQCMRDHGIEAEMEEDFAGNLQVVSKAFQVPNQADIGADCSSESGGPDIAGLFRMMKTNPSNVGLPDLVAGCLVREGLVPEGFTGHEWENIMEEYAETFPYVERAEGEVSWVEDAPSPTAPAPTLPGGIPMDSPLVEACEFDPIGTGLKGLSSSPAE